MRCAARSLRAARDSDELAATALAGAIGAGSWKGGAEVPDEPDAPTDDILLNRDPAVCQVPRWTVSVPYLLAGVLLPIACLVLHWGLVRRPGGDGQ